MKANFVVYNLTITTAS